MTFWHAQKVFCTQPCKFPCSKKVVTVHWSASNKESTASPCLFWFWFKELIHRRSSNPGKGRRRGGGFLKQIFSFRIQHLHRLLSLWLPSECSLRPNQKTSHHSWQRNVAPKNCFGPSVTTLFGSNPSSGSGKALSFGHVRVTSICRSFWLVAAEILYFQYVQAYLGLWSQWWAYRCDDLGWGFKFVIVGL